MGHTKYCLLANKLNVTILKNYNLNITINKIQKNKNNFYFITRSPVMIKYFKIYLLQKGVYDLKIIKDD